MPRALKGGFPTWWTNFGQGKRDALMIHCSLAHSGAWSGLARHLSGALSMTAFDMPGHGRSADWDGRGDYQGVTTAIAADFMDGPTDVIGHSFGATVALRLAVERPDLVRSLVLIEPVLFALAKLDHPETWLAMQDEARGFSDAMAQEDNCASARAFTALWGDGTPWEAIPEADRARMAAQMPLIAAGIPALYEDAGGLLRAGVIEALEMPILLIEGSESPEVIGLIHDGLAARLPHARRAVIIGAGHMAPVTHARQVASEILRFLHSA